MLKPRPHARTSVAVALCLCAFASIHASAAPSSFDAKTLRKAARLVEKLRRLDAAAFTSDERHTRLPVVSQFYPALHIETSGLPAGDLKTELSTAAFYYEDALHKHSQAPLNGEDNAAQLLRAKARLHVARAEALRRYGEGDRSASTLTAISELEAERATDLTHAARALSALKGLDAQIKLHSSRARLEDEGGAVAHVSFDRMANDFNTTEATVVRVLSSLPRSAVYYHLRHALNSYRDGLFWWRKNHRRAEMVVSVDALTEPRPPDSPGIEPEVVNYIIIGNWKSARRHILKAEAEIAGAPTHAGLAYVNPPR